MPEGFHPRTQGDLGEAAAIQWLTSVGPIVSFPLFHSPDYDLIADIAGRLMRIQVKTSTCRQKGHGALRHLAGDIRWKSELDQGGEGIRHEPR